MNLADFIKDENRRAQDQGLRRHLQALDGASSSDISLDGRSYLNFSTNDYLGLSRHPEVVQAAREALERHGAGGRSSRLISGTLDLHRALEEKIARFKGTEAALVFPTGFMANMGALSALLGPGDAVIMDRLNHASLMDAAKLSRCRLFVYEHRSLEGLERALKRTRPYARRLVVTDSLFSMDGDFAPLAEMSALCKQHGVWLMMDDAHATGVCGTQGIGAGELFNVLGKVDIVAGTLSKALGSQGGFICGSRDFIQFLVNCSRPFIYTTAILPAACGAALKAFEIVEREPARRVKLLESSRALRQKLLLKFPDQTLLNGPPSPIVPFVTGTVESTLALSARLKEVGIYAPAIRPPTVPKNECRLRFSLSSDHSSADLDRLVSALLP